MTRCFRAIRLFLALALLVAGAAVASEPMIVAHRAGTADYPENTLWAIRQSLVNGADALWLSVQLSADGVPVLYRPQDLSALTQARGPVAAHTAATLARLNAGWNFQRGDAGYVYRHHRHGLGIPSLESALAMIPAQVPVFLDLKATPAVPLVDAVAAVLERRRAWHRVWLYSTEAEFNQAWQRHPHARVMEARDATRTRLLTLALASRCEHAPTQPTWTAFEVRRPLQISEHFTLGDGVSAIADAQLWTPQAVQCFRSARPQVGILWIGVSSEADYQLAAALGVDAVMVDSPARARQWKQMRAVAATALTADQAWREK